MGMPPRTPIIGEPIVFIGNIAKGCIGYTRAVASVGDGYIAMNEEAEGWTMVPLSWYGDSSLGWKFAEPVKSNAKHEPAKDELVKLDVERVIASAKAKLIASHVQAHLRHDGTVDKYHVQFNLGVSVTLTPEELI